MSRFAAAVVVFGSIVAACPAQEPKWEPPAPPTGWKAVVAKDGTYQFAAPPGTSRSGTRDRTLNIGGVRIRSQLNYYLLKDGTTLEVGTVIPSGSALKGVTFGEVMDTIVNNMEKDDGYSVSARKDTMVGSIKSREYRVSKDKENARLVMFAAKPRIFYLGVTAEDAAKLDTDTANKFVQSLVLVPPEVVKAAAKEKAAKDEQAGKENVEKYGMKWTTNLKEMTPPEAPVVGVIKGKEFKPDVVTLRAGRLVFRQGEKGAFADMEVSVVMFLKGEPIEGKEFEIAAAASNPGGSPHVALAVMPAGAKLPKHESFLNKYALKLTFGAKDANGNIPGTIYLSMPDAGKSFLAGTFSVKGK
jgi:hypothetical protein